MNNPEQNSTFDVIVVGAGIMGSCAAYYTSKRGQRTLLLEQFDFLHHRASSHGESRTIRATYPQPHYSSMVLESASLWEQAQSEIGYRVYHKSQQLDMGPSSAPALRAIIHNLEQINSSSSSSSSSSPLVEFRILNSQQLKEKYGGKVVVPEDWIGVLSDLGGVIKATKAVSMFQALAMKNGAVLRDNTKVHQITSSGRREEGRILVRTADGTEFYGRKCIVTAGGWMSKLLESAVAPSVKVPIRPWETYVCYWKAKEGHEDDYSLPVAGFPTFASYGHPRIYGTPCLEYPGLIKAAVHDGRYCDPDEIRSWSVERTETLDLLKKWVQETFNGAVESESPAAAQSCMYSLTPDWDYVIDFVGGEQFGKDVVIAGGFSSHGFKMGPVVGRILADLALDGEAQGVDLDYFSLSRFQRNPGGNVHDFTQVGRRAAL